MQQSELHWRTTLLVLVVVVVLGAVLPVVDAYMPSRPHSREGGQIDIRLEGKRGSAGAVSASIVAPARWHTVPGPAEGEHARLVSQGASLALRLVPATTDTECRDAGAAAAQELSTDTGASPTGTSQQVPLDSGGSGAMTGYSSSLVNSLVFVACSDGAALVATATVPAGARASTLAGVEGMLATVRFQ